MASDFPAYVSSGAEFGSTVRDYTPGTGSNEPFLPGDLVYYDTTDNVIQLCGADPALIAGISEVGSAASIGANLIQFGGKVPIRIIRSSQLVLAMASSTTPLASHIGDSYGVTRNGSAPFNWLLDTTKTGGDARVLVHDVDITNGIFFCQVLNDQLQFAAIA